MMKATIRRRMIAGASVVGLACASAVNAQDIPPPTGQKIQYSPYPTKNFPNRVYFGDTHLHTSYSTDAGMIGNTLGPEEAYRFARGEEVKSSTGLPAKLQRPLDFLVVADHSENLGLAPQIASSDPELLKSEWGRKMYDLVKAGKGLEAFNEWSKRLNERDDPFKGNDVVTRRMWEQKRPPLKSTTSRVDSRPSSASNGPRRQAATTFIAT